MNIAPNGITLPEPGTYRSDGGTLVVREGSATWVPNDEPCTCPTCRADEQNTGSRP